MPHHRNGREDGIALVLALLFTLALSIIAGSLMVLSQSETFASANYKLMAQARYGAEAGAHKALNFLLTSYTTPGGAGDPLANYNLNVSPVTYLNQPVVLSAASTVASNYPVAAVQTAFNTAATGTLATGGTTVGYGAYATLVAMRQVTAYGASGAVVVQTWRITADGSVSGMRNGTVEVSTVMEQQTGSTHTYAVFATIGTCGALSFSGQAYTDSYDSSNFTKVSNKVVTQAYGGNVGTNGNLGESGGATINGTLSTPRTGVGSCSSGSVDAETTSGHASVTGGLIQLPQAVVYPPPAVPNPLPPVTNLSMPANATCASVGFPAANCSGSNSILTLNPLGSPLTLGNLSVSGGATLHLTAGTYALNSLSLSGNSQLVIDSGPVIMTIVGTGKTVVADFSGGVVTNASMDPSKFQVLYGGSNSINLSGGTGTATTIYAPLASVSLSGNSDFYGSILTYTFNDSGGAPLHYDRHLASSYVTVGNYMLSAFTWKKY